MALMHFLSDTNVTFKDLLRNSMALRLMARTHWVFGANIFAAIATGTALLQIIPSHHLSSYAAYASAFGISSPIGVAIEIIIDRRTEGAVPDLISAISVGLACGMSIFVAVNLLLVKLINSGERERARG